MKPRIVTIEIEVESDIMVSDLQNIFETFIDDDLGDRVKRTQRVRVDVRKPRKLRK